MVSACLIAALAFQAGGMFVFLIGAFFIGIWQVSSAILHTIFFRHHAFFVRYIRWYWGLAAGSIGLLVVTTLGSYHTRPFQDTFLIVAGFLALLACFLYVYIGFNLLYGTKEPNQKI